MTEVAEFPARRSRFRAAFLVARVFATLLLLVVEFMALATFADWANAPDDATVIAALFGGFLTVTLTGTLLYFVWRGETTRWHAVRNSPRHW